ncbi:hypothetical protein [Thioflexithrix psekupsensis]|uniref:Uncharacterized protein n=1 Tax=Thioflexithrix psekupsensis TaxID=1570016 RepID=A0A251X8S0_9GAMM|nr:hypothetical protein [Thioflexithrix psekupsensis]OUD14073.1 hypothetical protein TPSD3_06965 [Thioflexithrix psekupsensis]
MFNSTASQQHYEMALTPEEFKRIFAKMMPGVHEARSDYCLQIQTATLHLRIQLIPQPPRRIALLTLPVTRVELYFDNDSVSERLAFMQRFSHYFQRGGG